MLKQTLHQYKTLFVLLGLTLIVGVSVVLFPSKVQPNHNNGGTVRPRPTLASPGFGQLLAAPPKEITVNNKPLVPRQIRIYPILPAPYAYFSPTAVQALAQKLGFTSQATAYSYGKMITYQELNRSLVANTEAGTLQLSTAFKTLNPVATNLTADQAQQQITSLLAAMNLNLPILKWDQSHLRKYTLSNGSPRQASAREKTYFFELIPTIEVAGLPVVPPVDLYARFDETGRVIALSYWLPNLDYKGEQEVNIISPTEAIKKVKQGQGLLLATNIDATETARLSFDEIRLSYLVQPGVIYNLSQSQSLIPIYVLQNSDALIYVDARN